MMMTYLTLLHGRFASLISPGDIDFTGPTSPTDKSIVQGLLYGAYFWAGVVAVLVIVAAGVLYILSQGDAARITRAKNAIIGAVIGLVVILLAYAITAFAIQAAS